MIDSTFLQILLFIQAFVMGVVAVFVARYAYLHFKGNQTRPVVPQSLPANHYLPPELKQHLTQASQARFQAVLNGSVAQLESDLKITTGHINNLVMRLSTEIISGELERYREELSQLHKKAEVDMGGIRNEIDKHRTEIEAKISQELEAEKQRLVKQIDTKLGDAVSSFLVETLQHNVDLGSQSAYLVSMLEEHKNELIKEVSGENQPAN